MSSVFGGSTFKQHDSSVEAPFPSLHHTLVYIMAESPMRWRGHVVKQEVREGLRKDKACFFVTTISDITQDAFRVAPLPSSSWLPLPKAATQRTILLTLTHEAAGDGSVHFHIKASCSQSTHGEEEK